MGSRNGEPHREGGMAAELFLVKDFEFDDFNSVEGDIQEAVNLDQPPPPDTMWKWVKILMRDRQVIDLAKEAVEEAEKDKEKAQEALNNVQKKMDEITDLIEEFRSVTKTGG